MTNLIEKSAKTGGVVAKILNLVVVALTDKTN